MAGDWNFFELLKLIISTMGILIQFDGGIFWDTKLISHIDEIW